jgi:hypothetical protein
MEHPDIMVIRLKEENQQFILSSNSQHVVSKQFTGGTQVAQNGHILSIIGNLGVHKGDTTMIWGCAEGVTFDLEVRM